MLRKSWKNILRLAFLAINIYGWIYLWTLYGDLPKIELHELLPEQSLRRPVLLREFPDHQRFAVLEKGGIIYWFYPESRKAVGVMLDLRSKVYSLGYEEGLLGMAFDPLFAENRRVYIAYSMEKPLRSRLSRFTLSDANTIDPGSERVLFEVAKPENDHNGGALEFGPDGMLYVAIGEGHFRDRSIADKILQNRESFYGALLRLDVSGDFPPGVPPYRVPGDNPFVGSKPEVKTEIWALGFRNPWRFSFDRSGGGLYVNDVGGIRFEEVNKVERGGNYGWPVMEGDVCRYSTDHGKCDKSGKVLPIGQFSHKDVTRCITGGYVYRGKVLENFAQHYIFGTFDEGIFSFANLASGSTTTKPIRLYPGVEVSEGRRTSESIHITSVNEDHLGELYVTDYRGRLFKLQPRSQPMSLLAFFIYTFG